MTSRIAALYLAVLWGALLAGGCSRGTSWIDAKDRSEPWVQKGWSKQAQGDIDSAIQCYRRALEHNPAAARAHLDMAILLHDHKKDYIGALCHYRSYLDLRPSSEKRQLVEGRMQRASQLYAATIVQEDRLAARQLAVLQSENERLKQEVEDLKAARSDAGKSGRAVSTASAARRTYQVKPGDSLSGIAGAVYNDRSRWRDIYEANRDVLGSSYTLKVGQELTLP